MLIHLIWKKADLIVLPNLDTFFTLTSKDSTIPTTTIIPPTAKKATEKTNVPTAGTHRSWSITRLADIRNVRKNSRAAYPTRTNFSFHIDNTLAASIAIVPVDPNLQNVWL
jgi:hypothetical protein